jgi:hypothetical protein
MSARILLFGLAIAMGCGGGGGNGGGNDDDAYASAREHCVDVINMYRATLGLAPYARWSAGEECADGHAENDASTGIPHDGFRKGSCGAFAQNECPNWPGPPASLVDNCLAQMWAEGPGQDFSQHGHYLNMSSTRYTQVACGFYQTASGRFWAVQNFK